MKKAGLPYTKVTGKIPQLFEKIKTTGDPKRVDLKWLKKVGFGGTKNDRTLLNLLERIGFIDSSGGCTQVWADYRSADSGRVLAEAIREGYAELYQTYPDAHSQSREAIIQVAMSGGYSEKSAVQMYQTFRKLCELASFDTQPTEETSDNQGGTAEKPGDSKPPSDSALTVNINVQISLPLSDEAEVYDTIFESMQKHLLRRSE